MTALVLVALLAADRQLAPEVAAGVGVGGTAYTFAGGRWGDAVAMPYVLGRGLLGPGVGELEVLATSPLSSNSAATSFTAIPRIGFSTQSWSLLVGVSVQVAPSSISALQVLPSLRLRKSFSQGFGLSLGIFDLHGQAPVHLSAELGAFDIGYIAPLGVSVGARIALHRLGLSVQLRGLAFRLLNAELALFTVGLAWGGES